MMKSSCTAATAASIMYRAVVFNNEGVSRVESGAYIDATESFANVLETLKPFIPGTRPCSYLTDEPFMTLAGCPSYQVPSPVCGPQQSPGREDVPADDSQSTANCEKIDCNFLHPVAPLSSESHFVFRDPIDIPFDIIPRTSAPSEQLITKFVVVVMYNIALSVHLSALQSNDITLLNRARRLYELAFQMHLEESCDVTLLYSLALMNNLGLIYQATGDEERSKTCFRNMLATMMYLLESDEAKTIKQWDGMLSNVIEMMFKEQIVAASAA